MAGAPRDRHGGDRLVAHVAGEAVETRLGERIREAWKEVADAVLPDLAPFPGATTLLDALRERSLRVVLATSGKPDHTDYALDLLDARPRIDELTTSDDVGETKPAPDLLSVARQSVDAVLAVMIGDSVWDAVAARDAAMPMIGVLSGGTGRDELTRAGAWLVYDDVAALTADLDHALSWCAQIR
ncbi:MAG: hypothetical protein JWQ32_573 [Marmoricola sp.]|nr:hypothetical protein [Marmoricola sp.]